MATWYWDRMAGIYLDGRRYDLALAPARAAAAAEGTAERWETAGNIAFHPHRFTESRDAYRHAAALSDAPRTPAVSAPSAKPLWMPPLGSSRLVKQPDAIDPHPPQACRDP